MKGSFTRMRFPWATRRYPWATRLVAKNLEMKGSEIQRVPILQEYYSDQFDSICIQNTLCFSIRQLWNLGIRNEARNNVIYYTSQIAVNRNFPDLVTTPKGEKAFSEDTRRWSQWSFLPPPPPSTRSVSATHRSKWELLVPYFTG